MSESSRAQPLRIDGCVIFTLTNFIFFFLYYSNVDCLEIVSVGRLYDLQILFQVNEKNIKNICIESLKVWERGGEFVCVLAYKSAEKP